MFSFDTSSFLDQKAFSKARCHTTRCLTQNQNSDSRLRRTLSENSESTPVNSRSRRLREFPFTNSKMMYSIALAAMLASVVVGSDQVRVPVTNGKTLPGIFEITLHSIHGMYIYSAGISPPRWYQYRWNRQSENRRVRMDHFIEYKELANSKGIMEYQYVVSHYVKKSGIEKADRDNGLSDFGYGQTLEDLQARLGKNSKWDGVWAPKVRVQRPSHCYIVSKLHASHKNQVVLS